MPSAPVEITHRAEFSAAHRLHADSLSDEENRRIYGPCNDVHGRNYAIEVSVRGPIDPTTGMVMNLTDLMRIVHEEIVTAVDHKFVNEQVDFLQGIVPTAENLAIAFWERIDAHRDAFPQARLTCVRVVESTANSVEYRGPEQR